MNGQAYGQSYYCHPFTSPPFLPQMVAEAGKAYKRLAGDGGEISEGVRYQRSGAVAEIAEDFPSDFGIVARVRRIGEVDFALVTFACQEDGVAVDSHRERL